MDWGKWVFEVDYGKHNADELPQGHHEGHSQRRTLSCQNKDALQADESEKSLVMETYHHIFHQRIRFGKVIQYKAYLIFFQCR